MKPGLSSPAVIISAAYLAFAGTLTVSEGYGGFFVGMPWTTAVCLGGSDTILKSVVAASIITNTVIVYLVAATYQRLKANEGSGKEARGALLLTRRQLFVFATTAAVLASPLLSLTVVCGLKNEEALILMFPFLVGMPWVLLYLFLPFDIPGLTSAGIPDASGHLKVTVFHLALVLLPALLNIYIAVRLIFRGRSG
jgi:hypothetical protein